MLPQHEAKGCLATILPSPPLSVIPPVTEALSTLQRPCPHIHPAVSILYHISCSSTTRVTLNTSQCSVMMLFCCEKLWEIVIFTEVDIELKQLEKFSETKETQESVVVLMELVFPESTRFSIQFSFTMMTSVCVF